MFWFHLNVDQMWEIPNDLIGHKMIQNAGLDGPLAYSGGFFLPSERSEILDSNMLDG